MQSLLQGECLCIQVNFDTIQEIGPKVGMHTISRVGALSQDYAIYTWILSCLHATFLHVSFRLGPMLHVYSASTIHDCFLTQQHNKQLLLGFYTEPLLFAGKWSSPTTGPRPSPCYLFSFTAINNHQAVLFGGNQPGHHKVDDCFFINFESMVC